MVLFDASVYPVEAHVKSFGALPAHVASEDFVGCRAVSINWVGRLRVAHFNKGRADRNSLLAVEEDLSSFSLGGGSNDGTDGLTFGEDRFVWSGIKPDVGQLWILPS